MKINVTMPFDRIDPPEEFNTPAALREVSAALDATRFHAGLVTDHPVPTVRWLEAGGHYAQDPLVMLSLVAGCTRRIRLQTGVLVLPYRNPFIVARMAATLDVFSGGRLTLSVGAGYLKGEYRALGVDFDKRNELMDEYIRAMKAAWTQDEFTFEGDGYVAFGNRIYPQPVQEPTIPILIGGNAKRAIRRAVELGDGWNPFFNAGQLANTARTAEVGDAEDVAELIEYMREYCEKVGRAVPPEVVTASILKPGDKYDAARVLDAIGALEAVGCSGAATNIEGATRAEWLENLQRFDEEVLAKL